MAFFAASTMVILAEPPSQEEFMKTYQPILDRVYKEKLSPYKQTDIGLLMFDVVCFNNGTRVLNLSAPSHVACVNPDTVPILVQRGWGVTMYNETKWTSSHGSECDWGWIIYYDEIKPKNSELIYSLRYTLKDIQETLLWHPVVIDDPSDTHSIIMYSVGSYSPKETRKIIDSLNSVAGVEGVGLKYGACS
jgi:hypothetical protein